MPEVAEAHLGGLEAVRIAGESHAHRGRTRGQRLGERIRTTAAAYAGLFTDLGIPDADQRTAAADSLAALRAWAPSQHEEVLGIAEGARLDPVDLGLTLARTEILTLAEAAPGECSLVAHQGQGPSVSAQTWDWYARFTDCWHLHRVEPLAGEVAHAGFTEYGMPGKIGLNAAGIGVHLNILRHRDDRAGGVPVHSVLARVLSEATSVEDGIDLIRSAPTTSSSVLTLSSADRVAMVEVAPGRVVVLEQDGWVLHTNHFLAEAQQDGAMLLEPGSNTHERLDYLEEATGAGGTPEVADDLLPLMCSPLQDGGVALLPDPAVPEAERLATLVTVRMDPALKRVRVSPGVPQYAQEVVVTYHL